MRNSFGASSELLCDQASDYHTGLSCTHGSRYWKAVSATSMYEPCLSVMIISNVLKSETTENYESTFPSTANFESTSEALEKYGSNSGKT